MSIRGALMFFSMIFALFRMKKRKRRRARERLLRQASPKRKR